MRLGSVWISSERPLTWAEFWEHVPKDPGASDEGLGVDACDTCRGRLMVVVLRAKPEIQVVCEPCKAVLASLALERGGVHR